MHSLIIKAPARINMLGSGVDGIEGDYYTLTGATAPYCTVHLQESQTWEIFTFLQGYQEVNLVPDVPLSGGALIARSVLLALMRYYPLMEDFIKTPLKIKLKSDIPRQSGLAGSTSMIAAITLGIKHWFSLDYDHLAADIQEKISNKPELMDERTLNAEIFTRIERNYMGVMCGYADRYIISYGGLALIGYAGKLYHKEIGDEPPAVMEHLPEMELPVFIIYSGQPHSSGDVHGKLREIYMEHKATMDEGSSYILSKMRKIGQHALQAKELLLANDWQSLGELITENHRYINEVLHESDIPGGAGETNNMILQRAISMGAYGGKLTGAGGGGSVFVVVDPAEYNSFRKGMIEYLRNRGYYSAQVIPFKLSGAAEVLE